jgi:HEPN domain-containing protein
MLSRNELRSIARARLKDARALFRARRYDGAVYLCGYAVECAMKARICNSLHWAGFPSAAKEFSGLASFKTHDLETLLLLSGREPTIRARHLAVWSEVSRWAPEVRYNPVGQVGRKKAMEMIQAIESLLAVL